MQCVQKIKNSFLKICFYAVLYQMSIPAAFAQNQITNIDSLSKQTISISQALDSNISSKINNITDKEKQIGKLPFKRSQLPELFLVILLLVAFAMLRYFFPRYLPELWHQYLSFSADVRVLKNDRIGDFFPGVFFDILFVILGSVYAMFFAKHIYKATNIFHIQQFSIIAIAIIIFLVGKTYFIKLLSWVYKFSPASNVVLAYSIITRHILLLVLIPSIAFLLLINPIGISKFGLYLSLIVGVAIYLFHLLKMVVFIKKTTNVSFFDIFIYLCSVEVLLLCIIIAFLYRQLVHTI
jgi:Domain of unknown function (DUF4271)